MANHSVTHAAVGEDAVNSSYDLIVLWRVYEHCNLNCSFCGYSAELKRPRFVAEVDSIRKFGAILGDYGRHFGKRILVSWLGGEPLLWPQLPKLSNLFREEFGLHLAVTSNGTPLASRTMRSSLIADYSQCTVSVDGLAEVHDACRKAPGLFDRVRNGVVALRSETAACGSSLRIHANTILMRRNIAAFEDLCRKLASWGVQELTFNQLGGNDRPEFFPDNRLLPEQVDRFIVELAGIRERIEPLGMIIRGAESYLHRLARTSRDLPVAVDDCRPGTTFLFIDERSRIAPCSFTAAQYGVTLDEVKSVDDLARLPRTFAERRRQRSTACEDCHSTQVFGKFDDADLPLLWR